LKQSLSEISCDLLERMADKVDKRGRRIGPKTSAENLHPLRKSLKKLRYSLEFLSSLYPRKATQRYLRSLKNLQKSLGIINDAAVARRLADELAQDARRPVFVTKRLRLLVHSQRTITSDTSRLRSFEIVRLSASMTETDADRLGLLPYRSLSSFHRLRDRYHGRLRFRVRLQLTQVFFSPRVASSDFLVRH
jgi:hypothetical protein